ncbi:unnamed protein product [Dovyalis caffra]|uniref:Ribosomal protein L5 n=1 Tax=Dovyalis caffra TaxID=77055 RepID=A0AAV1R6X8_9ROSI|nr:unnamed protein product [Dovyalis caffra]
MLEAAVHYPRYFTRLIVEANSSHSYRREYIGHSSQKAYVAKPTLGRRQPSFPGASGIDLRDTNNWGRGALAIKLCVFVRLYLNELNQESSNQKESLDYTARFRVSVFGSVSAFGGPAYMQNSKKLGVAYQSDFRLLLLRSKLEEGLRYDTIIGLWRTPRMEFPLLEHELPTQFEFESRAIALPASSRTHIFTQPASLAYLVRALCGAAAREGRPSELEQ